MAIGLWAGAAGAAPGARTVPNFNVQAACNELKLVPEALSADAGEPDAIRHCVDAEQEARKQLVKEWTQFSPADRHLCVGEASIRRMPPAYSELETCLQMTRDSRQLNNQERQNGGAGTELAAPSSAGPTAQIQR